MAQKVVLTNKHPFFLFFLSLFLVGLGQNAWIPLFAFFASFGGYALFWRGMLFYSEKKKCFLFSFLWFVLVQAIQLSWMTSTEYQGYYIFIVYGMLLLGLGLQFGLLSLLIARDRHLSFLSIVGLSSFWVLMEWSRLWFLSGFTWNPSGLALTFHHFPMQWASVVGVYGLSFWVILVNLLALKILLLKKRKVRSVIPFFCFALFPYLFGIAHVLYWERSFDAQKKPLSVLLVQTSLLPEERDLYMSRAASFISPHLQWERIISFLSKGKVDLIVLPESAVPFDAYRTFHSFERVQNVWKKVLGADALSFLPELKEPLAAFNQKSQQWEVSNNYWAQAISNFFHAEVIVGLDDRDFLVKRNYNAAFYFQPFGSLPKRYEKRVLVPIAEYFPFLWCKKLAARLFGIVDQFSPGQKAKVFSGSLRFGVSICYEETFAHLMRQSRSLGADCFVNLSNDVWFPFSKLPWQHFDLGRLRSVENGVPLLRACNTGVTGGVDCFGRILRILEDRNHSVEKAFGALPVLVPKYSYPTLYTLWGDFLILSVSGFFLFLYFLKTDKKFFKRAFRLFSHPFSFKYHLLKK